MDDDTSIIYWQDQKKRDKAQAIFDTVRRIEREQAIDVSDRIAFAQLYLGRNVQGFLPGEYIPEIDVNEVDSEVADGVIQRRIARMNATKSCVDGAVAKIMLQQVVPRFATEEGDITLAERGRLAEQYIKAILRAEDAYRSQRRQCKGAAVFGLAWLKTYPTLRGKLTQIVVEFCRPGRVVFDNQSALDLPYPLQIYDVCCYSRRYLRALYPERKLQKIIDEANVVTPAGGYGGRDMVFCIEAYDMTVGDRVGQRVVALESGILHEEPWKYDRGPFTPMRWQEDLVGHNGLSGVGDVEGLQEQLDSSSRFLKGNSVHLSNPFMYTQRGSHLRKADVEVNTPFRHIEGDGPPPEVITPPIAHPQHFQWQADNWEKIFHVFGLSEMHATGEKPVGLRSGKALATWSEIGSGRFADVGRQKEHVVVDLAWQIVRCARELEAAGYDHGVSVERPGGHRRLRWSEVSLADDQFYLGVYPASGLPDLPAGRAEFAEQRMQSGLLDREEARSMAAWPDLSKADSLALAGRNALQWTFERMLASGEYIHPSRFLDIGMMGPGGQFAPGLGHKLATQYYCRGMVDGLPPDRLQLLERWMDEAQELAQRAHEIAQAQLPKPPIDPNLPAGPEAAMQLAQAQQMAGGAPPMPGGAPPMPQMPGGMPPGMEG